MLTSDVLKNGFLCAVSYARECSRPKMLIVVTQNESDPELNMVSKYVKNSSQTGVSYYAEVMPKYLDSAIEKIKQ